MEFYFNEDSFIEPVVDRNESIDCLLEYVGHLIMQDKMGAYIWKL